MSTPFNDPPDESRERPFWSVMIPVYNPTEHLAKTLESVLSQDPGPDDMQIEVIDGHSTVRLPDSLVQRVAGNRVSVFRHPAPLSMAANWNSCIERARGEWVHILHQDDIVLPGFYSRLRQSLSGRKDVASAFTRWMTVDDAGSIIQQGAFERETPGILLDSVDRIATAEIPILCAAIVVRKSAYGEVGNFRSDLTYVLDREMWVRLASRYPIWYEPEAQACYRVHMKSETARLQKRGEDLQDQVRGIAVMLQHLAPASEARTTMALHLVEVARGEFVFRRPLLAIRAAFFALRLSRAPSVTKSVARLFGWVCMAPFRIVLKRTGLLPRTSGGGRP